MGNDEKSLVGKPKVHKRICIDPFPVWEDGFIKGKAYMNLLKRDSLRLNLNVVVYSNGRYPYFKKNKVETGYTVRIPLPVIEFLYEEIQKSGNRVRKNKAHKWKIRRFKTGGVV